MEKKKTEKMKCPLCKGNDFKQVAIGTMREYCYLEGYYLWLYRCENCGIIIGRNKKFQGEEK